MAKVLSIEQKPAPACGAREAVRVRLRRNLGSPRVGPAARSATPGASRWPRLPRQRGSPARVRTCFGDEAADAAAHLRKGVRASGASAAAARRLGGATARAGHATACRRHAAWRGAACALPRHARAGRRAFVVPHQAGRTHSLRLSGAAAPAAATAMQLFAALRAPRAAASRPRSQPHAAATAPLEPHAARCARAAHRAAPPRRRLVACGASAPAHCSACVPALSRFRVAAPPCRRPPQVRGRYIELA